MKLKRGDEVEDDDGGIWDELGTESAASVAGDSSVCS